MTKHFKTPRAFAMLLVVCSAWLLCATSLQAQSKATAIIGGVPKLGEVGVDEHLGKTLPGDLTFTDHRGQKVQLKSLMSTGKPTLLAFVYHSCPMLCSMVMDAAVKALSETSMAPGADYQLVTISIDPHDTPEAAAKKRTQLLTRLKRPATDQSWSFLVGDEPSIQRATKALGFRYLYDTRQRQYAHPAVLMFLTPSLKISRYLYGLQYDHRDITLSFVEAQNGRSISTLHQIMLYCYKYDPNLGAFVLQATRIMQLGGLVTALALGVLLAAFWRQERRRRNSPPETPSFGGATG